MNDADWFAAFDKYKRTSISNKIVNEGMTLSEFKGIFWWEWSHRFLGRMIGFAFALPLFYFWWRGRLRHGNAPSLLPSSVSAPCKAASGGSYCSIPGLADRVSRQPIPAGTASLRRSDDRRAARLAGAGGANPRDCRPPREHVSGKSPASGAVACRRPLAIQVVLGAFVAGLKAGPHLQYLAGDGWTVGAG